MAEEIKNQGQQENAENLNENVSGQAKEIISAALEETQNRETSPVLKADSNVTDKFKGLPMRELIAAPLIAAAEAQQELAATAWNFYQQIAFDGKSGNKARILEFDVERPIQQDGKMTTMSIVVLIIDKSNLHENRRKRRVPEDYEIWPLADPQVFPACLCKFLIDIPRKRLCIAAPPEDQTHRPGTCSRHRHGIPVNG